MLVLFPDTNFFLQYKSIKGIDWKNLYPCDDILLIVTRPVMKEIDRFKSDGSTRRAKRSRSTNSLFRQALDGQNRTIVIREKKPRVELKLDHISKGGDAPSNLDMSIPDDELIAICLAYKKEHRNNDVQVITNDTGMLILSQDFGLNSFAIPKDWQLPPESDDNVKRIRALEQELELERKRQPEIAIRLGNESNEPCEKTEWSLRLYQPLTDLQIHGIKEYLRRKSPQAQLSISAKDHYQDKMMGILGPLFHMQNPSREEQEKYSESYEIWMQQIECRLQKLHCDLQSTECMTSLEIMLENRGGAPADGLSIEFSLEGSITFMSDIGKRESNEKPVIVLPFPPAPPRPRLINTYQNLFPKLPDLLFGRDLGASVLPYSYNSEKLSQLHLPNKHEFYRSASDSFPSRSCEFNCEEFRHEIDTRTFRFRLFIESERESTASLKCTAYARNLPNSITVRFPISWTFEEADTEKVAMDLVDKLLKGQRKDSGEN